MCIRYVTTTTHLRQDIELVRVKARIKALNECTIARGCWSELPLDYLQWLVRYTQMDADVIYCENQEIGGRKQAEPQSARKRSVIIIGNALFIFAPDLAWCATIPADRLLHLRESDSSNDSQPYSTRSSKRTMVRSNLMT